MKKAKRVRAEVRRRQDFHSFCSNPVKITKGKMESETGMY
jgi:hypothetical protein